jgi:hypothetical protein
MDGRLCFASVFRDSVDESPKERLNELPLSSAVLSLFSGPLLGDVLDDVGSDDGTFGDDRGLISNRGLCSDLADNRIGPPSPIDLNETGL